MSKALPLKPNVKIGDAAKILGVSIDTLRRWEKKGKLEAVRTPGGTRLYNVKALQKIIGVPVKPRPTPSLPTSELLKKATQKISPLQPVATEPVVWKDLPEPVTSEESWLHVFQPVTSEVVLYLRRTSEVVRGRIPNLPIPPKNLLYMGGISFAVAAVATGLFLLYRPFLQQAPKSKEAAVLSQVVGKDGLREVLAASNAVLAASASAGILEINTNVEIGGTLNGLNLIATSGSTLNVLSDVTLDQDVSTTSSPTFESITLSNAVNQIGGNTITFPSATTTLVGTDTKDTLTNKTMSGSSNTFTDIPNSALTNHKVTITAGTNLTGGGAVELGKSITISAKDSPSFSGQVLLSDGTASAPGLAFANDTNTGLYRIGADNISLITGGTAGQGITIDASGNVGLNTITPTTKLHVVGTGNITGAVTIGGTLGVTGATTLSSTLAINGNTTIGDASGDTITFNADAWTLSNDTNVTLSGGVNGLSFDTTTLSIDAANDRVGIGTTSPNQALEVIGSGRFSSTLQLADGTNASPAYTFTNDTNTGLYRIDIDRMSFVTGGASRLSINSSGNVGIGTTDPATALEVIGAGTISDDLAVNGGDITTSATTFNLINATATTLNIGGAATSIIAGATNGAFDIRGNLGIGTSSPGARLAVSGGGLIGYTGTEAAPVNGLAVSGNVGIGTTSPNYKLEIVGNTNITGNLTVGGTTSPASAILLSDGSSSTPALSFASDTDTGLYRASSDNMRLVTGGMDRITINSAGNVGIGVTSPATAFHVGGITTVNNKILAGAGSLDIGSSAIRFGTGYFDTVDATNLAGTVTGGSTSNASWTINSDNATNDAEDASLAFERGTGADTVPNAVLGWDSSTHTTTNGKEFDLNSRLHITGTIRSYSGILLEGFENDITTATNEHLAIMPQGTGNVGIGTTGPGSTLQINGNTVIGFGQNTTAAPSNGLAVSGNVGIGSSSPSYKLEVVGTSHFTGNSTFDGVLQLADGTNAAPSLTFLNDTNTGLYRIDTDRMSFVTGGASALTINSAGNVGIGTTGPTSLFSVAGTAAIGSGYAAGSPTAPSNGLIVQGNVGIGTSTPNVALQLVGATALGWAGAPVITAPTSGLAVNGNVGIGTTVAGASLQVNGNVVIGYSSASTAGPTNGLAVLGNVGIGTTSPQYNLHVVGTTNISGTTTFNGTLQLADGSLTAPSLAFTNDTDTGLFRFGSNGLALTTGGSGVNLLSLNSSGNVGIGTTGPAQALEVRGTARIGSNLTNYIEIAGAAAGSATTITSGPGAVALTLTAGTSGNSDLTLSGSSNTYATFNAESLTIPTTGADRGIAITASGTNADIELRTGGGNGVIYQALRSTDNTAFFMVYRNTGDLLLQVLNNGRLRSDVADPATVTNWSVSAESIFRDFGSTIPGTLTITSGFSGQRFNAFGAPTITAASALTVTNAATVYIAGAPIAAGSATITNSAALVIASGNVGIGYTAPVQTLHVQGTEYISGNLGVGTSSPGAKLSVAGGGLIGYTGTQVAPSNGLAILGNVGIGTTSPAYNLQVVGTTNITGASTFGGALQLADGTNSAPSLTFANDTNTGLYRIDTDRMSLVTGGASALTINSSGNVGIGNTNPGGSLIVNSGNVGIGTNSPVARLDVRGAVLINQTSLISDKVLDVAGEAQIDNYLHLGTGAEGFGDTQSLLEASHNFSISAGAHSVGIYSFPTRGNGTNAGIFHAAYVASARIDTSDTVSNVLQYWAGNPAVAGGGTITNSYGLYVENMTSGTNDFGVFVVGADTAAGYFGGNVGIGNSSPGASLQIHGNGVIGYGVNSVAGPTNGLAVFGNVGIGTTSPAYKLEVVGTAHFTGAATYDAGVSYGGNLTPLVDDTYDLGSNTLRWRDLYLGPGTMHIGTSTSDEYSLSYDTTNNRLGFNVNDSANAEIVFDSSGNVGIGTTGPLGLLHVGSSATAPGLVVTSGGNVGIGFSSPQATLDVRGVIFANDGSATAPSYSFNADTDTGLYRRGANGIAITTGGAPLALFSTTTMQLGTDIINGVTDLSINGRTVRAMVSGGAVHINDSATAGTDGDYVQLAMRAADAAGTRTAIRFQGDGNANLAAITSITQTAGQAGHLIFQTSPSGVGGNLTERIRIQHDGNVGIGTSAPTSLFSVAGTTAIGLGYASGSPTAPSNGLIVQGNVGIGTSTPGATLQIAGNQVIGFGAAPAVTGPTNGLAVGGNLGVGNSNPLQRLHVNQSETTSFIVSSAGNVGIGTTSPTAALSFGSTSTINTLSAGNLTLQTGAGTGSGAGGTLALTGGAGGATGTGGAITLTTGAGGGTSGNSGALSLTTGSVTSGTSGAITINPGAVGNAQTGGAVTITGGDVTPDSGGSGTTGSVTIRAGDVAKVANTNVSASGSVTITGGRGISNGTGGAVTIQGGPHWAYNGSLGGGGGLTLAGGDADTSAGQANGAESDGGTVTLRGGTGWSGPDDDGTGAGGTLSITGGTPGVIGAGGAITLATGPGGTTSGNSGDLTLRTGSITSGTAGNIYFQTNGTNLRMTVANGGNVGIGTSTPGATLQIAGNAVIGFGAQPAVTAPTNGLAVGGNVGIGTSNPSNKLSVVGGNIDLFGGNLGIGTSSPGARLAVAGGGLIGYSGTQAAPTNGLAVFGNVGIGTTSPAYNLQVVGTTNITGATTLGGNLTPFVDDTYDLGSNTLRWRDLYLGPATLHIGTSTSDEYSLSYDTTNNRLGFNVNDSANPEIVFDSSGNVGIGTTGPGYLLDIASNSMRFGSNTGINDFYMNQGGNAKSALRVNDVTNGLFIGSDFSDITLNTSGRILLTSGVTISNGVTGSNWISMHDSQVIDFQGNVGVGTSSPGARLAVAGGGLIGYTGTQAAPSNGLAVFGNVGIGTTSPAYNLQVVGTTNITGASTFGGALQLADGTSAAPSLTFTNDTDSGLYRFGTDGITLVTGGTITNTLSLNSSGNVGIGTTNPGAKLDVRGSAVFNEDGNDADFRIESDTNANAFTLDAGAFSGVGAFGFGTDVAAGGYIMINPTFTAAASNDGFVTRVAGTVTGQPNFNIHGLVLTSTAVEASSGNHTLITSLFVDTPSVAVGDATVSNTASIYIAGAMAATVTGNNYALWVDNGLSRFDGNVGIGGVTSTYATTQIQGSGTGTALSFLTTDSSGTQRFAILDNGNVGIGTTGPGAKLEIFDGNMVFDGTTNTDTKTIRSAKDAGTLRLQSGTTAGQATYINMVGLGNTASIQFGTADTEKVRISESGNVGIGTSAPTSLFSVAGTTAIGLGYASGSPTAPSNGLIVQGNVGIGTSTPGTNLQVVGNAAIGFVGAPLSGPTNGLVVNGNVGIGTSNPTALFAVGSGGQFQVNSNGSITQAQSAVSGGQTALSITPGAHTAVTAESIAVNHAAQTLTITGAYATQRFHNIAQPTVTAASALAVTTGVTLDIGGAPTRAGSAQILNPRALRVTGNGVTFQAAATSSYMVAELAAHTLTLADSTSITSAESIAGLRIGQISYGITGNPVFTIVAGAIISTPSPSNQTNPTGPRANTIAGIVLGRENVGVNNSVAGQVYSGLLMQAHTVTQPQDGVTYTATPSVSGIRLEQITIDGQHATPSTWNDVAGISAIAPTFTNTGQSVLVASGTFGGNLTVNNLASTNYHNILSRAHTITLAETTQMTATPGVAGISIRPITVNQSGGAVTVNNAASLYVASALTAGSSVTLANNYALWVDAGTSRFDGETYLAMSSGNVGIGTSTPGAALQVAGAGIIGFGVAPSVSVPSNGLAVGGNVGIGNSNPLQRFHVNQSETTSFVVASSGNVGIGTSSPTAALSFGSTSTINTLAAGNLTLQTGAGSGAGAGGTLALTGGAGGATGAGGAITLTSGAGGSTSGASGAVTIGSGTTTSGNSGAVILESASTSGNSNTSGNLTIRTGGATGGSDKSSGSLSISTGDPNGDGNAGPITITAGGAGVAATGDPADITITAGAAGNGAADAGDVILVGGDQSGTTSSRAGGRVSLTGGSGNDAGTGGAVVLTGGDGSLTGAGGAITLTTGAGGSSSGASGALTLASGTTTSGRTGDLTLRSGVATGGLAGDISFQTNGSNIRMTVMGAGNIGIGTSTPGATLQIAGNSVIGFGAAPAVTGPSNGLAVGGNIGVGVTNPAAKLEVLGNLLFTSGATRTISVADQGSSNTAGSQLSVTGAAGNGSGAGGALALTAGAGGATGIGGAVTITAGAGGSSSGAGGALTITAGNATGTNSNGGQLSLVGGRANHTGTTPDLLITGGAGPTSGGGADETGGNVLIQGGGARIGGGGSKGGDVQLLGGGGDGSGAGNAGGDVILTGGSPNTGAGAGGAISITTGAGGSTSGASGALTLASGTTTSGRTGDLTLRSGAATGGNAGDIFFQTNGTNLRMTVAYGGNVGIGTSTPGATLQIAGNQVIGYGGAPTAGPSDGLAVFGNVGVGTTSPNYKLEVIGSINVTGDIFKNGTAYNNPDYAFEQWATGQIALNADKPGASTYTGILSLEDTEAFVRQNFQLPRVASATGIFERGDILLEKVEEAYIHLFDLNRKIASNSAQLSDLSAALTTQTINLGSFSIASSSAGLTISSAGQNLLALDALGNMKLAGTITSEAGAFDIAEDYPATDESIEAGDVVAISETVEGNIEKSSTPYQNGIIGVISTKAGLHLGGEDGRPVALAGRVPVKVTTENGAIKAGDYLTSSSIPGLAMKMTRAGTSIGKALESFSCPTSDICQGTVLTFINVGWHDPTVYFTAGGLQQLAPDATQTLASISLDTEVASDSTQASSSASLNLSDDPLFKDLLTKIDLISSRLDVLQKVVVGTESAELVPASSSAELLAAIEDVQLNASGSAILTGDLTVAGRTTLADVGITGTLNAGLLTINGLGSSINTLAGDLKLQNLALGGIDILAGKIKIDIKGNIVSEGTITAKEVEAEKVTTQKLVITEPVASSSAVLSASTSATLAASAGTVTIKAGQTSIDVETSALTVKSLVFVTPDKPIATSGKVKDATTVTISIPTPTPEDVRVNWWIIN